VVVVPTFAPEWERHSRDDESRERYVSEELRRLFNERAAVLLAVLQVSVDDDCRMVAMRQLTENADSDGNPIYDPAHQWRLRLKDGVTPPSVDAQGRKLPKEKLGRVLVTKVGNLGGQRARETSSSASREWGGERRAAKSNAGMDLYVQREVTAKPTVYSLSDAVLILQRWGVGVQARQYLRASAWRPGEALEDQPRGQEQWLVEEVPPPAPSKTAAA